MKRPSYDFISTFWNLFSCSCFFPPNIDIYMVHENIFYEVQACIVILHIYNTLNRPCICKDTLHTGADPGFQVRGGTLKKKLHRAEEGANILGVFRVKNCYLTPKNHSFYNYRGRREKCWGISCEKSRFYAPANY